MKLSDVLAVPMVAFLMWLSVEYAARIIIHLSGFNGHYLRV